MNWYGQSHGSWFGQYYGAAVVSPPQVIRVSTRAVGGGGAPWAAATTQTRQSDRWVEATDFDRATVDSPDWTADDEEVMMIITTFLKVVTP